MGRKTGTGRSTMKIEFGGDQPVVDAALIAPLMDLDVIGFRF